MILNKDDPNFEEFIDFIRHELRNYAMLMMDQTCNNNQKLFYAGMFLAIMNVTRKLGVPFSHEFLNSKLIIEAKVQAGILRGTQ